MANCPKCGAALENGTRFCANCGFDLAQAANSNPDNNQQAGNNNYAGYQQTSNNNYTGYQQQTGNNNYAGYQQQAPNNSYADYQQAQGNTYYQQNNYYQQPAAPFAQMPTDRNLVKFILLNFITFGIYGIVWWTVLTNNVNTMVDPHDGKHSTHYCLMTFLITGLTWGIGYLVWIHNLSRRIGEELARRGIQYSFGADTFWLWNVLGSLIFVGPFVYLHKLCVAMNLLCESYNYYGNY